MTQRIRTIKDLELESYSLGVPNDGAVTKSDAPILSTTTGMLSKVFGAQAWAQFNQEANVQGALPKYAWTHSGFRIISARAVAIGSGAGQAESTAIPDTVKPTAAQVSLTVKTFAMSTEVSQVQELLSRSSDDAFFNINRALEYLQAEFNEHLNKQLLGDVDTVAGNSFESMDRVISSYSELTNLSLTAGDSDIYGLDRDAAASFADAYVNDAAGTDRVYTDALQQTLFQNVLTNGGDPSVIFTGHDTGAAMHNAYAPSLRYSLLGEAKVTMSVNGVQTLNGIDTGITVATWAGLPVIKSKDVFQDTISRIYMADTHMNPGVDRPKLGLSMLQLPTFQVAGIESGNAPALGKLANEAVVWTYGELVCTKFKAQGKIRDLK